MLVGAFLSEGLHLSFVKMPSSFSYLAMTAKVMKEFGLAVDLSSSGVSIPGNQVAKPTTFKVSSDASAASYFFALGAMNKGPITVDGICPQSQQGDLGFVEILAKMGARVSFESSSITILPASLRGVVVDMNTMSDVVPTLAIVALCCKGPTEIQNVAHLRYKECDRFAVVCRHLRSIGAQVIEWESGFRISPPEKIKPAVIDSFEDHRIAMAFFCLGQLLDGKIEIDNFQTVNTSFPKFLITMKKIGAIFEIKKKN